MKRTLLLLMVLLIVCGATTVWAERTDGLTGKSTLPQSQKAIPRDREVEFSISTPPTTLLMSYYDYMQGSYSSLPMNIQADEAGGGIYITYQAQRTSTGTRRVFYTYLDSNEEIINNNELTNVQVKEGFPAMAIDEPSGKPIFAWHANADADEEVEVRYTWDAYLFETPGLINDPMTAVNNPITITSGTSTTTDNEFSWPSVNIGPSPTPGMRRVYIQSSNHTEHTGGKATENFYIAYADFTPEMMENGTPLTWSFNSIPELNAWNVDTVEWRRGFYNFCVGNDGKIYVLGYHSGTDANDDPLEEPDMDVYINDNYGAGEWRTSHLNSHYPAWNPLTEFGAGPGFFQNDDDVPYTDDQLYWSFSDSSHNNAVLDNNGIIHFPALHSLQTTEGTYFYAVQYLRDIQFNTSTETFAITELYPQGANPHDANPYTPWDVDEDHVVDEYSDGGFPLMETMWPFIHWDYTAMENEMTFYCNYLKMSESNAQGMMAALWTDSWKARQFNENDDQDYVDYQGTPELYICVSPDNGYTWSEPIVLSGLEYPQLVDEKITFAYPANKIIYQGVDETGHKLGKLYIMYFDDNSWGPGANAPAMGQNDGGYVKYMALDITFPISTPVNEEVAVAAPLTLRQNYPNPFNPETTIKYNLPKAGKVTLSVYNLKGQLVNTLVSSQKAAGDHDVTWNGVDSNGKKVSSGMYYYTLSNGKTTETRKMILMK